MMNLFTGDHVSLAGFIIQGVYIFMINKKRYGYRKGSK